MRQRACHSFQTLKQKLGSVPMLRRPNISTVFQLHTDWRALGLKKVLIQKDAGREYVIAYASESNNKAKSDYSSYEGEIFWRPIINH